MSSGPDWIAFGLAGLGGACMGTYPLFVKTPAVLAARIHPAVFQGFKSLWVLLTGMVLILWRWALLDEPAFVFNPWAVASACAWIPAGLCVISAVPRAGMGNAVLLFDASTTLFSFAYGWLVNHEPIKPHFSNDGETVYYLTPWYGLSAIVGMAGLVLLPAWMTAHERARDKAAVLAEPLLSSTLTAAPSEVWTASIGYAFAITAGLFSTMQYAIVTVGKRAADASSAAGLESINPLGSWTASFGIGSVLINILALAALIACAGDGADNSQQPSKVAQDGAHGTRRPFRVTREQLQTTLLPGSAAGALYCASLVLTTMAVDRGGNATVMAQKNALSLVVSGGWAILWYKEIRGRALVAWCMAAALTVASVIALSFEKQVVAAHG